MNFWDAAYSLSTGQQFLFVIALLIAFGFEFINGFHDTANAVTTVIYTHTLLPRQAVAFSALLNFLGVLLLGTALAFSIVNLLPVDLLVEARSGTALVTVLALLIAGVIWNLGTWYMGLPVSSSHTLIGSILGVGVANGLLSGNGFAGVRWDKAIEVGLALLFSPIIGFLIAFVLLVLMKKLVPSPRLYEPPVGEDRPPGWVRAVLIATCGGVSFAHGSNDGQKGMGLLLLVLIGFLPTHYALNEFDAEGASRAVRAARSIHDRSDGNEKLREDAAAVADQLDGKQSLAEIPQEKRWELRKSILTLSKNRDLTPEERKPLTDAVEYVPLWVVIGTALALGLGTMVGYKRIVVTVAERIGTTHLTYAQGAVAQLVAALTVAAATVVKLPVSTTHVLSSGVAGTMVANGAGVQPATLRKILLAWCLTLPCSMLLSGLLYAFGRLFL